MREVYLDNNATTPTAPEVIKVMTENSHLYGNASSMHSFGRRAMNAIEEARGYVGKLLNAPSETIIFTSGGSESDNNVFHTAKTLIDKGSQRKIIIASTIEHPAIIETCKNMKESGYDIRFVGVDAYGEVLPSALEKMMSDQVLLVSIMSANNETGTIQPIDELTKIAHAHGALMHTDAVQAVGKIDVDVAKSDVDYLSISGHKFYGPKGVGALYVKKGAPFETFVRGGHQEGGKRAGTYNTNAIVGMGEAARLISTESKEEREHEWALRERLRKGLIEKVPDVVVNGHPSKCLPGTLNVSFPQAEGESILLMLDFEGIAVSTGSACATGSLEPSYVLLASGLDIELAHGSIRFSLGRYTTQEDVDYVISKVPPIIKRLREISTL
jgi:cysteine desulfurase